MILCWELLAAALGPLALLAAALGPLAAAAPAASGEALHLELAADDECGAAAAGARGQEAANASCAIHALQRRGASLSSSLASSDEEVEAIAAGYKTVCLRPMSLRAQVQETTSALAQGLPPWKHKEVPSTVPDVVIAFLIQVTWKKQLPVVRRVFDRLYSPKDVYLYLADKAWMTPEELAEALPQPLPDNVLVQTAAHAPYFMWPRVEVVLQGLLTLLQQKHRWDFALHLSESDYPVHGLDWIRSTLASQRGTNFVHIIPRCQAKTLGSKTLLQRDAWYWWGQSKAVSSCPSARFAPFPMQAVAFPTEAVERMGLKLARGVEWVALTRELVKYALSPELLPFRKLVAMHLGSDEIFWQSLVVNIPNFTQTVSQRGWYIQWGHGNTSHSPDTLTETYRDSILQSRGHLFFMRKVSPSDSSKLLDEIDALEEPPIPAQSEMSGENLLQTTVPCPKGTGLGNSAATCRRRSGCGCPPHQDPRCDTESVIKHPYCLQSQRRCAICEGTWC